MQGGIVVIGGGTAGLLAAASACATADAAAVTLISSESCLPYSPTSLPYLLSGKIRMEQLFCQGEEFFSSRNIRFLPGRRVVAVHPERKAISFAEGEGMAFQKLIIATGASPIIPYIEGIDSRGVFVLRTLADVEGMLGFSRGKRSVAVLGAGLIGMEVALAFAARGMKVTVIEKERRVMPLNFDEEASWIIERAFEKQGIVFRLGATMVGVYRNGDGAIEAVGLANGERIASDLLVVAVGVVPEIELVKGSGIECGRGILVDEGMRTSLPDIFAAGDVAEGRSFFGSRRILNAILPNAAEQGRVAGTNAAGGDARYDGGLPMNVLAFPGGTAFSIGDPSSWDDSYEVCSQISDGSYRKLVFDENKLIGAILVNDETPPGVLRTLIRRRTDISRVKQELISSSVRPGSLLPAVLHSN